MTDGEVRILGNVHMNTIDGINRPSLKMVSEIMLKFNRGSWILVHVLEKPETEGEEPKRSNYCGYVEFKDLEVVISYTNDLGDIPRKDMEGAYEHNPRSTHGLAPLQRYFGT